MTEPVRPPGTSELHVGLTEHERELCHYVLDNPTPTTRARARAFRRFQRTLSPEQQEEFWAEEQAGIRGTAHVLAAWPVERPRDSTRFMAFDWAASTRGSQSGTFWIPSGFVGPTSAGEAITHLAFECWPGGEPLTSEVVRAFSLPELLLRVKAVRRTAARRERLLSAWGVPDLATLDELEQVASEARGMELRRGRRGFPPSYYRGLAFDYLRESERGRGALERLATTYGRERQTIRDHLHRAKGRGFLQGGKQGVLSYSAGPRLFAAEG